MMDQMARGRHCLLIHQMFAALNEAGGTRHAELMSRIAPDAWRFTVVAGPYQYLSGTKSATGSLPRHVAVVHAWSPPGIGKSLIARALGFLCFMLTSFWKALRTPGVDVVWGTVPSTFQGVSAWLVARLRRKPFVLEVRDLWPDFAVAAGVLTNPAVIAAGRFVEKYLYRAADRVVVNSPGFIDHIASKGVPLSRIYLIANGVDVSSFETDNGRPLPGVRMDEAFTALYAGAHGAANDLDTLLEAAAKLVDDESIMISLIGDGRERARLQQVAEQRGLFNVSFHDPVPKSAMPQALASADVCIATLRADPMFATTYPNKVFDYMAAARPTILAIDGPIREVIEKAGGGVFVPPGDADAMAAAIQAYADDRERCKTEGEAARMYVREHFDRDSQAASLEALLDAVVRSAS